jgi:hypothetical protein
LKYKLRYAWPLSEIYGIIFTGVRPDDGLCVEDTVTTFEECSVLFEPDIDQLEETLSIELKNWRLSAQCQGVINRKVE